MKYVRRCRWHCLLAMLSALLMLMIPTSARSVVLESRRAELASNTLTWLAQAAPNDTATFIVLLKDIDGVQAQVARLQTTTNLRSRRAQVVQVLTAQAQRNERAVRDFLRWQQIAPWANNLQFYAIINGFAITTNKQVVDALSRWDRVKRIEKEWVVTLDAPIPGQELPRVNAVEWNIAKIGADRSWTELGIDGTGTIVGSIDTGVRYTHEALRDNYMCAGQSNHTACWLDALGSSRTPTDRHGHGSHTVGSAVGRLGIGVAPGAKWIACGAFDKDGSGISTDILECMDWFLHPGGNVANAPDVVINSYSSFRETTDMYKEAVANWINAGIFPEYSIGNYGKDGCRTSRPPGNYTNSFGVGATNNKDVIAEWSSRGPSPYDNVIKPDVSAPGVNIRSARNGSDTAYQAIGGTSMSGPHVAGQVALLRQANPNLTVEQLATLIKNTALGIPSNDCSSSGVPNNVYGYGRIDAYKSVQAAKGGVPTATPVTPTPTPVTPSPTPVTPTPTPRTVTPTPITPTPTPRVIFEDSFEGDKGWRVNPNGNDTATGGRWERGVPEATSYELPAYQIITLQLSTTTSGSNDLVTGRLAGSSAGANDIDGGMTSIQSPAFELPGSMGATLSFNYYLAHLNNASSDDYLRVRIIDIPTGGVVRSEVVFEKVAQAAHISGAWTSATVDLSAFAGKTISIVIEAADAGTTSLVEAAVDDVVVRTASTTTPTPITSTPTPVIPTATPTPITITPTPVPGTEWQPYKYYQVGDIVTYQGVIYRCIRAHVSRPGTPPPSAPTYWERIS